MRLPCSFLGDAFDTVIPIMSHLPITDASDVNLASTNKFEVPAFIKGMRDHALTVCGLLLVKADGKSNCQIVRLMRRAPLSCYTHNCDVPSAALDSCLI